MTKHVPKRRDRIRQIDYKHWGQMDYWEPVEFSALSLNIDPKDIDHDPELQETLLWDDFEKRRALALRARLSAQHQQPSTPRQWLQWAQQKQIRIRAALRNAVEPNRSRRNIGLREKNTLLGLVYGMAMAKYGFSPNKKGPAIRLIQEDLRKFEVQIDDQTIRNKLIEAVAEFSSARLSP